MVLILIKHPISSFFARNIDILAVWRYVLVKFNVEADYADDGNFGVVSRLENDCQLATVRSANS